MARRAGLADRRDRGRSRRRRCGPLRNRGAGCAGFCQARGRVRLRALRIVWTERALINLEAIGAYLSERSPAASTRILEAIGNGIESLAEHPQRGRPGRVPRTRELVISRTRYLVAYRVVQGDVQILAVIHGAQRW